MDMTGKTAVITGASRGIGAATARVFAEAGANVVLMARTGEAIGAIAREIGARALAITCDVSSWSQVKSAIDQAVARFGRIDVMINNAAVLGPVAMLREADVAAWDKGIDINLKGVFHGMRAAAPVMRKAGGGTVLTVGSGAAHTALEGWSQYCASKAAALMLTRALDKEERGKGIRALTLSPGTVATDMQREVKASGIGPVAALNWEDHIPPEWPARALLWMCGPEADRFLGGEVALSNSEVRAMIGLGA